MPKNSKVLLRTSELCRLANMPAETIISFVEYGIVEPSGKGPEEWEFEIYVVSIVKKAYRLQRDFDIDMNSIALVMDLLDKLERLETDNKNLKQRLNRFLAD